MTPKGVSGVNVKSITCSPDWTVHTTLWSQLLSSHGVTEKIICDNVLMIF